MKKKILSLALATAVCVTAVACGGNGDNGTNGTTASNAPVSGTSASTSQSATVQTPPGMVKPAVDANAVDPVTVDLEGYAKLVYNPECCEIFYKIEEGVGAKKKITVSIEMKDGYVFDGWSKSTVNSSKETVGGAIANGATADSTETTYTYTVSKAQNVTIWANYSAQLVYNPNGGTVVNGGETYTQKYSVVWLKSPNTLPDNGYFSRKGYTLIEYNTKADGTGESVSPGSKTALTESGVKELYCIWEKQNDEADFTTKSVSGGVAITAYKGTSTNVVIPDTIGSKKVVAVAANAFANSDVTRVVLSKNVTKVEDNAFKNCKKLESFVMFDSVTTIGDDSFTGSALKNLQINAVLALYDNWTTAYAAPKMDRLVWAKANGKKVIAIYGGSGSLFGWDCEAIEEAFGGEYVVVNLGTNANATATMFFDYFAYALEKDDVLLWAPEPGEWTFGSTVMGSSSMWGTSANPKSWEINAAHYDIFKYMDISEYSLVFDSYEKYASSHKNSQKAFDKFSPSVSVHGDALDNEKSNGGGYSYSGEYERREALFEDGTLDYIAELIGKLDAKGVKVLHTYAAMDKNGKSSIDADYMKNTFEKIFKEKFEGIEMISDINDCFVESTQIKDSAWHLTRDGAEARTAVVIADLKAALGK